MSTTHEAYDEQGGLIGQITVPKAAATPADTARANGWTVGTRLIGDEGYGPTIIEITAIGREQVLAVTTDGTYPRRESCWDVRCRDWQVAR